MPACILIISVTLWQYCLLHFIVAVLACLHIYYMLLNGHAVYMIVLLQCLPDYTPFICYSVAILFTRVHGYSACLLTHVLYVTLLPCCLHNLMVTELACIHIYYLLLSGHVLYMISWLQWLLVYTYTICYSVVMLFI